MLNRSSLPSCALALVLCSIIPQVLQAQTAEEVEVEAPPETAPPEEEQPAEEPPEDPAVAEARARIDRGRSLGDAGEYEAALVEFNRAGELLEGHPRRFMVDYNVGVCYEGLFQYHLAIEAFRRYLEGAGSEAEDRAEVEGRIAQYERRLGTIHLELEVEESYEVWVDGHLMGRDLRELLVPGGVHQLEIRAPGHIPAREEVMLPERSERQVEVELDRLPSLSSVYFWMSAGLAVVTLSAGAILGGIALGDSNELQEMAADDVRRWEVEESDNDRVAGLALGADVLFGLGAAFATCALIFAFFTRWSDEAEETSPPEGDPSRLRLSALLTPSAAALSLTGAF